ncbi:MAG: 3-deoxy-7-phosphoheptulonate synthase [Candidatus Dadabacteria bacterium]|nr:MAG: 3-deoxy-7-phosphoheptulonate synthase [Candidatus Dadabacteria bacterium]
MIIQLEKNIKESDLERIKSECIKLGLKPTTVNTASSQYLVSVVKNEIDIRLIGSLSGVTDVHRVSDDYKLVSRKWKVGYTTIELNKNSRIGDGSFCLMAGPCSIESESQIRTVLKHLKENGISVMRGGVFKPRTSPYSFQGLGLEGLKLWHKLAADNGVSIISEVMAIDQIEKMYPHIDIYQVGARNAQNFPLLHELGKVDKPVLIKRGMSGTIDDLLHAAEYVFSSGNEKLILCERGIRTFERAYRNTLDLNAVPILKDKSHLPVVVDPSHGIGIRKHVPRMALAAVASGCDGLLLEIHPEPEKAFSDGQQTLNFEEASRLYADIKQLLKFFGVECEMVEGSSASGS